MRRIFISHSHYDSDFAAGLARFLASEHVSPWLSEFEIEPGQDVARAVYEGIAESDGAVIIVGEHGESDWARHEWSLLLDAHWRSKLGPLVAVLLGSADGPAFTRETRVVRARATPEQWHLAFSEVRAALVLDAPKDESVDLETRDAFSARLGQLAAVVERDEPEHVDLARRWHEIRNVLAHAESDQISGDVRARLLHHLAVLELRREQPTDAVRTFTEALALLKSVGDEHGQVSAQYNLGVALLAAGDTQEARNTFEQALARSRGVLGNDHPLTAALSYNLGLAISEIGGDPAQARSLIAAASESSQASLGPDHPTTRSYVSTLRGLQ